MCCIGKTAQTTAEMTCYGIGNMAQHIGQYSRRNNLRFYAIPLWKDEECGDKVIGLLSEYPDVHIVNTSTELNARSFERRRPRAIIVRFVSRRVSQILIQ